MNENFKNFFKGKRVTIMGLGLLGRGVGDAAFLARCGAKVLVTDKKSAKELASSVKMLKKYTNIHFRLGGHDARDFSAGSESASGGNGVDMVLKAAGVPLDSPFVKEARKHKAPVYMSTALFVKLLPKDVTVIGVTGTRGKTTTSFMIYEIIKQFSIFNFQFSKKRKPQVFLGGNVKGVSTLALLPKVKSGDFVVLELDSWQLQGFSDLKISPHIAVFTTFLPDHMNYYGGSMARYFADKANVFRFQISNFKFQNIRHALIVGEQAIVFVKKWYPSDAKRAVVARAGNVPKNWKLKILGEHNRANAACAVLVADALDVPREITKKAVESFCGVSGRLELVRELRGVNVYNDTTATTPDATIAALRALGDKNQNRATKNRTQHSHILKNVRMLRKGGTRNIVLIMGGADKGLDMSGLVKEIPKWCKAVIWLPGSGTDEITSYQLPVTSCEVKTLREAVHMAYNQADIDDTILFSPAFASFGMFKNEYDRGEQFNRLVRRLKISNI